MEIKNSANDSNNNIEEGKLYVCQDGILKEILRDPEDTMKKVRILDEAIKAATDVQKRLRSVMGGYKPDLSLVCSALIIAKAKEEDSCQSVASLFSEMTQKLTASV